MLWPAACITAASAMTTSARSTKCASGFHGNRIDGPTRLLSTLAAKGGVPSSPPAESDFHKILKQGTQFSDDEDESASRDRITPGIARSGRSGMDSAYLFTVRSACAVAAGSSQMSSKIRRRLFPSSGTQIPRRQATKTPLGGSHAPRSSQRRAVASVPLSQARPNGQKRSTPIRPRRATANSVGRRDGSRLNRTASPVHQTRVPGPMRFICCEIDCLVARQREDQAKPAPAVTNCQADRRTDYPV